MGIVRTKKSAETPDDSGETAQAVKRRIVGRNTSCLRKVRETYVANYDDVYNNPEGLTPAQVLAPFGSDAAKLFGAAAASRDLAISVEPGSIPLEKLAPPVPIRFNNDGTVTVLAAEPSEPASEPPPPVAAE